MQITNTQKLYSGFGNEILYKMCADFPDNKNPEHVAGKLFLIGRAYSAAVERRRNKEYFSHDNCAQDICDSRFDEHLKELRGLQQIDKKNAELVFKAHDELMKVFRKHTKLEKRSLASKYLHFHAPNTAFIFDSIARSNLPKSKESKSLASDKFDFEFQRFVYDCIFFRDNKLAPRLTEYGNVSEVTPRLVDLYLSPYGQKYLQQQNFPLSV